MKSLLFYLVLEVTLLLAVQGQSIRFTRFSSSKGLVSNTVYCVYQDQKGFLWFGTLDGLYRYDGYEVKVYKHHRGQVSSLSNNRITKIAEDGRGDLWLYDDFTGSLNRFNPRREHFKSYFIEELASSELNNLVMRTNTQGKVCLYYEQRVCLEYQPGKDAFQRKENVSAPVTHNLSGEEYQEVAQHFQAYLAVHHPHYTPLSVVPKTIFKDSHKNYWLLTKYHGLYTARRTSEGLVFTSHLHTPVTKSQVRSEDILTVFEDHSGVVWIGTKYAGLYQYARDRYKFRHISEVVLDEKRFVPEAIRALTQDVQGNLWIGTNHQGLLKVPADQLDPSVVTPRAKRYAGDALPHRFIRSLWVDSSERLWVGHYYGFSRYDPVKDRFQDFLSGERQFPLKDIRIYGFQQANDSTIWMAGWDVLIRYNPLRGKIKMFVPETDSALGLLDDNLREVLLDKNGKMRFVAGERGLVGYDTVQRRFIHYKSDSNDPKSLPSNNIFHICEDSKGRIWVATSDGLAKFYPSTQKFVTYTMEEGLPGSLVYGILEDDAGFLWLSTSNGLSKFDPDRKTFRNYDVLDGLQSNEFTENAFFKTSDGEMVFGGVQGLNWFHPAKITDNLVPPGVVLTDFKVANKSLRLGEKMGYGTRFDQTISFQKKIVLSPKQNLFSIEFAALHFVNPSKNRFAYRLEGLNQDWIELPSTQRFVTFQNLSPGTYRFRLKACNSDGVWNETGLVLTIVIQPAFYATWWFWLLVFTVCGVMALVMYQRRVRYIQKRERMKAMHLESELMFLKNQVNPHFLFNSLNNIYALCQLNSQNAAPMVGKLSEMMRYMIYDCEGDRVSLQKEIAYLNNYIALHQLKSEKELNIQFLVEGNPQNHTLVPMLLINFLENSFKHGDIQRNTQGYIFIHIQIQSSEIVFLVRNSIQKEVAPPPSSKEHGIGLENVKQRLNLLYPHKHSLQIKQNPTTFEVRLKLNLH